MTCRPLESLAAKTPRSPTPSATCACAGKQGCRAMKSASVHAERTNLSTGAALRCDAQVILRGLTHGLERYAADELRAQHAHAFGRSVGADQLYDAVKRRRAELRNVEGDLHYVRTQAQAQRFERLQSAVAAAQCAGNAARDAQVRCRELHVEGDQNAARADRDRARGDVFGDIAEIRTPIRQLETRVEPFEFPLAHGG